MNERDPNPVEIGPVGLRGYLGVPQDAKGLVIFAHGSGSGRMSPRNNYVADELREAGLATLLLDLLTRHEERDCANVFDIPLLASRLGLATEWAAQREETRRLPVGYFGASTGAGAAIVAAAERPDRVMAVVSRGGRPDLAMEALPRVRAPTLLIVGSLDGPVIDLNGQFAARITAPAELVTVPGAGHLFEEEGTLDEVVRHATRWFLAHLASREQSGHVAA